MFRDDWLLRVIQEVADALARIVAKKKAGQHEEALEEVDEAMRELMGRNASLVRVLDAATIAHMCPNAQTVRALADLRREEADLKERLGERAAARQAAGNALALYELALERAEGAMDDDPALHEAMEWLRARA